MKLFFQSTRNLTPHRTFIHRVRQFLRIATVICLAACSQISGLQHLPTLPATFAIPAQSSTILPNTPTPPSPTLPPPTLAPSLTFTPATSTSSAVENTDAEKSTAIQSFVQTQLATLNQFTSTDNSCTGGPCSSLTITPTLRGSPTYTITNTPNPPYSTIQILTPGPQSKVISPIHLSVSLRAIPQGTVRVELIGEDGRLMYREVSTSLSSDYTYYQMSMDIDFQISSVAEAGRLQVSMLDSYQRIISESSVDLIMLSIGGNGINPPDDQRESIMIQKPYESQLVSGGILHIEGIVRPLNNNPLSAELYTMQGNLVGSSLISFNNTLPVGTYRPFSMDLKYTVSQQRDVRLEISEEDDDIPGIAILSSVEIWLNP